MGDTPGVSTPEPEARRTAAGRAVDWWCRDRTTGEIILGQAPNAAIIVWLAANAVRLLDVLPEHEQELGWIGTGALTVWGLDELVRGVNPMRRVLGAVVLGWQVFGFASS